MSDVLDDSKYPPLPPRAEQPEHAKRFFALFAGSERSHGILDLSDASRDAKGKMEVRAKTVPSPATTELWRRHLAGDTSLGIDPLLSDGNCRWGAIDIDEYRDQLSLVELFDEIERHRLPLVPCRSKSGGAHLYLFLPAPAPAAKVKAALQLMVRQLGRDASTEVFPKQTAFVGDLKTAWLNMPYQGGEGSSRYAIKKGGLAMTAEEFLSTAERAAVSIQDDPALLAPDAGRGSGPVAGPAVVGGRRRVPAGNRPEQATRALAAACRELADAPPGQRDVTLNAVLFRLGGTARETGLDAEKVENALRGVWLGMGKDGSDFDKCWPRAFDDGVEKAESGTSDRYPEIEAITKVEGGEDHLWDVKLVGHDVMDMLLVRDVLDYRRFSERCAERLGAIFDTLKGDKWTAMLRGPVSVAETRPLPRDETLEGEFFDVIREFCLNRHGSERMDELLSGKAVLNVEQGRIYFQFRDFRNWLELTARSRTFRGMTGHRIGKLLNGIGREGVDCGKTTVAPQKKRQLPVRWVRADLFEKDDRVSFPPIHLDPV